MSAISRVTRTVELLNNAWPLWALDAIEALERRARAVAEVRRFGEAAELIEAALAVHAVTLGTSSRWQRSAAALLAYLRRAAINEAPRDLHERLLPAKMRRSIRG